MTRSQAVTLTVGTIIHQNTGKNADGTCIRWRVNGQVKEWVRDPKRFRIPIKHGMYDFGYLEEINLDKFHLPTMCCSYNKYVARICEQREQVAADMAESGVEFTK